MTIFRMPNAGGWADREQFEDSSRATSDGYEPTPASQAQPVSLVLGIWAVRCTNHPWAFATAMSLLQSKSGLKLDAGKPDLF